MAQSIIETGESVTRGGEGPSAPPESAPSTVIARHGVIPHTPERQGTSQNAKRKCQRPRLGQPAIWPLAAISFSPMRSGGSKTMITLVFSISRMNFEITCLFSITHWEHFFCPFVFNNSFGGSFIFDIFLLDSPTIGKSKGPGTTECPPMMAADNRSVAQLQGRGTFGLR
jgi:hypothetical protein